MLLRLVQVLAALAVFVSLVPHETQAHAFLHLLTPRKVPPPVIAHYAPHFGVPLTEPWASRRVVQPRLQRFILASQPADAKTSTALVAATDSHTFGALNPRDGSIVWRRLLAPGDEAQGVFGNEDAFVVFSGTGGAHARAYMGRTGALLWEAELHNATDGRGAAELGHAPVHASFFLHVADMFAVTNGRTVQRMRHGSVLWRWSPADAEERVLFTAIHDDDIYVFGAVRGGATWRPRVSVLSRTGELIGTHDVKGDIDTLSSVILLAWAKRPHIPAHMYVQASGGPHAAWVRNGAVHMVRLNDAAPKVQTLRAKAHRFERIVDVGLGDRGYFVGVRTDARAEVLQVSAYGTLYSAWVLDEYAPDAIYDGTYDKAGHAYVCRTYFTRAQHMLNQHIFWADAVTGGEHGQVTGFSQQYDHDRHGNVLAAPFEVIPMAPTRAALRSVLVTSSGGVQLVQDGERKWLLEEGLAHPSATAMIAWPDTHLGPAAVLINATAENHAPLLALEPEGVAARWARHAAAAARAPVRLAHYVLDGSMSRDAGRIVAAVQGLVSGPKPLELLGPIAGGTRPPEIAANEAPRSAQPVVPHDRFGLDKMVVAASQFGKVYGLNHTLRGSHIVWERSLVGYGDGEGAKEPVVRALHIVQTRRTGALLGGAPVPPVVAVVAEVTRPGMPMHTRVFEYDPLTGEPYGDENGRIVCRGPVRDIHLGPAPAETLVAPLLFECTDGLHALDKMPPMHTLRLVEDDGERALLGELFRGSDSATLPTWRMPLAADESVVHMVGASRDRIASLGRVLGDRSVLYKFLDPHARVVVTHVASTGEARLRVLDVVSGTLLYSLVVPDVVASDGIRATIAENWITLQYATSGDDGLVHRLVSVELYEPDAAVAERTASLARGVEGVAPRALPVAAVQSFLLPFGVRDMAVTRTTLGVTTHALVVATSRFDVVMIPRNLLDPRRPLGKPTPADLEEGLVPYKPAIANEPSWSLTGGEFPVLDVDEVSTSPSNLESSSLVLATGLDWVYTVASPSGQFDRLQTTFNKMQLLLTILGLAVGIAVTNPLVRMRRLQARW